MPSFLTCRRTLLVMGSALLIAGPVLAETVKGNGVIRSQARTVTAFTGVGLGIAARVEVRLGNAESVTVEADENLLPLIETSVEDGTLEIKAARKRLGLESKSIKVVVQARQIDHLDLGGAGSIVADALRSSSLRLAVGGAGTIDVKRAECDRISAEIGGSGDVKVAGSTRTLSIDIGGSGDVGAAGLVADEVSVAITGSGDATVAARSALRVTVAGSGDVQYYGDPKVSRTIVGSGRVKRVGPLPQ